MRVADDLAVLRDGRLIASGQRDAFDIDRMIALMIGRSIEQLYPGRSSAALPDTLLVTRNLGARGLIKDVNLTLHAGEVLGLFGLMGSGRTELARILFGLDRFDTGDIHIGGQPATHSSPRRSIGRGLAFVTENRREEGLLMDMQIVDNMTLAVLPNFGVTPLQFVRPERLRSEAGRIADAVRIKAASITQPARSLSGGNQQKVVLAKWLMTEPAVFIMDEPTRGVDVAAKHEIYSIIDRLAGSGGGVLFISSEIEELIAMCDRILIMSRGEIVDCFDQSAFDKERILRAAFREQVVAA